MKHMEEKYSFMQNMFLSMQTAKNKHFTVNTFNMFFYKIEGFFPNWSRTETVPHKNIHKIILFFFALKSKREAPAQPRRKQQVISKW